MTGVQTCALPIYGTKGLGCLIVDALSDQIQATRDVSTVGGTRIALTFSEPD